MAGARLGATGVVLQSLLNTLLCPRPDICGCPTESEPSLLGMRPSSLHTVCLIPPLDHLQQLDALDKSCLESRSVPNIRCNSHHQWSVNLATIVLQVPAPTTADANLGAGCLCDRASVFATPPDDGRHRFKPCVLHTKVDVAPVTRSFVAVGCCIPIYVFVPGFLLNWNRRFGSFVRTSWLETMTFGARLDRRSRHWQLLALPDWSLFPISPLRPAFWPVFLRRPGKLCSHFVSSRLVFRSWGLLV